jgi:hypothetical protein
LRVENKMVIGDLVKVRDGTMLAPKTIRLGLVIKMWIINNEKWFRVMWGNGNTGSIVSYDLELMNE